MKCIVCEKECEDEICEDCDRLMDMLYRKNPQDKEITLNLFRERGGEQK